MALPREISVHEFQALRARDDAPVSLLLDVRNHDEFQWVRLPGATLIPLPELEDRVDELESYKSGPVYVYCHHGIRSLAAAEYLRDLGYDAASVGGGIDAWSRLIDPALARY